MSNYLAVATVTETLCQVLRDSFRTVKQLSAAANVQAGRPEGLKDAFVGANVYLYRLTPNVAFRNADLPTRDAAGHLVQVPVAAWDLYYLISFYGIEKDLEPQRLMGAALARLHAEAILSPERIAQVVASAGPHGYLRESTLATQIEHVRLTPTTLTLDELSKLWTVFFQTTHALSVAYVASVVLIDADVDVPPQKTVKVDPAPPAHPDLPRPR